MDVRGYALTIGIVAALCSGMAVPASAMPNMPHAFAKHEVARCGGDVAHASKHYRYQNSSRSYSGDAAGCYRYGPSSPWYPEQRSYFKGWDLKTAKALDLTIPEPVLQMDEAIE